MGKDRTIGYTITGDGYIRIFMPTHPFATKKGYIMEHRLVMEKYLGRYLHPTEIVHHINGIKSDNRIKNLKLFSSKGKHLNLHLSMAYQF